MTLSYKDPIDELGLTYARTNSLKRKGIRTIGELCERTLPEVKEALMGRFWTGEVRLKLARNGLALKGDTPLAGLIPIESLGFRGRGHLSDLGFDYAEQLCEFTALELLSADGVGPTTLLLIRKALAEHGLALEDEGVYSSPPEYKLDGMAKNLKKSGAPGIVAFARRGENYLTLQLQSPQGNQLELRRPAPGQKMTPLRMIEHLHSLQRGIPYLPEAFDVLGRFAEELNGRSGIKSILTLNTWAAAGEKFQILELVMQDGKELDRVFHELDGFVFTGKHWILTEVQDQAQR